LKDKLHAVLKQKNYIKFVFKILSCAIYWYVQFSYFTKHIFQKLILRRDIFLSVAPYQPQIALLARNILKCTSPGGLQPKIVNNLFGFWFLVSKPPHTPLSPTSA